MGSGKAPETQENSVVSVTRKEGHASGNRLTCCWATTEPKSVLWLSASMEKLESPLRGAFPEDPAAEGVAINKDPESNFK